MNKISERLETKFSGDSASVESDERDNSVETRKSPANAPAQDKNDDQETVNQPGLGTQDDVDPDYSRDKGFDPYNTGPLDVSKTKESSSDE